MKKHVKTVLVKVHLNHSVPIGRLRRYVKEAVETWQGQCFPGNEEEDADPMWQSVKKAKVTALRDS